MPETETMDKLYLELSQFTTAKTAKELALENAILGCLQSMRRWAAEEDGMPSGYIGAWEAYNKAAGLLGVPLLPSDTE